MQFSTHSLILATVGLVIAAGITGELGLVSVTISIGVVAILTLCAGFVTYLNGTR